MRLRFFFLTLCLFILCPILFAQTGEWGDLLSYYASTGLTSNGQVCVNITPSTLLRYDFTSGERTRYSKLNKLSSANILQAKLLENGTLWVSYHSGRIDCLSETGSLQTISDLEEKVLRGERTPLVDFILQDASQVVGISRDYIYVFQNQQLIRSFPLWGDNRAEALKLYGLLHISEVLYFATSDGVYRANGVDVASTALERVGNLRGEIRSLLQVDGQLVALRSLSVGYELLRYEAGVWHSLMQRPYILQGVPCATSGGILLPEKGRVVQLSLTGAERTLFSDEGRTPEQQLRAVALCVSDGGEIYISSAHRGLLRIAADGSIESLSPVSPAFVTCGKVVATSPQGVILTNDEVDADKRLSQDAPFLFFSSSSEGGENIYLSERTRITDLLILDTLRLRYAVSTSSAGLFIFEGNTLQEHYHAKNSPLPALAGGTTYINAMSRAADGGLYLFCGYEPRIYHLSSTKEWKSAQLKRQYDTQIVSLLTTPRGFLFFGSSDFAEITAIDPEPFFDRGEGIHSQFLQGDQQFHGSTTLSMALNRAGDAWIGTSFGLVHARNLRMLLKDELIPLGGVFVYDPVRGDGALFEGIAVDHVLNDAGDRLWVSRPNRGVMCVAPNQKQLIADLTEGNSKLPANQVTDLAYEAQTGKLYIATEGGVVSLITGAQEPTGNYANVRIYPNPVRPDFTGVLTIDGLVEDSYLKIVDSGGELVRELRSNGGRATWDLKNGRGNSVASGVYFVFISDAKAEQSYAGKFVVVR